MNAISRHWQSFQDRVVPKDAPPVQVREMRRAFYAGAMAAITEMAYAGTLDEAAAVKHLEQIKIEALKFADEVRKGLA